MNAAQGRLSVRHHGPAVAGARTGLLPIGDAGGEPLALAYVPDRPPYRLALMLHGARGEARNGLDLLLPLADAYGLLLVAPQSAASSWDMIHGGFGPDVRRLDEVLGQVLGDYPVTGMTIGGFSDGASYALTLGMANGDLFGSVVAFSPGFAAPPVTHGRPRMFVSHGTADRVLPIDRCSRRLVPRLRSLAYDVAYEEFTGGHDVPQAIRERAADWLVAVD